jgi:hypothetical protein
MKNTIITMCVIVGLWVAVLTIPAMMISDKYEIVKLDRVNVNSSDLFTSHQIYDSYINDVNIVIIDDCENIYVNDKNIPIEYGNVYAIKYNRHLSLDGKRFISEAYKVNESPKDVICQGKQISSKEFYTNV